MTTPLPDHLVWIDLETTGLDPRDTTAAILEVGAIITRWDTELTEVARASMVLRPPGALADHDRMWASMPQEVRDMHTANGLWEEATSSEDAWTVLDADNAIAGWVSQHVGEQLVPAAGSGVALFDVPFVRVFFPRLASRLTYWAIDIGSTRRQLQLAGRDDLVNLVGDVEAKPHRGLADCELHVAEARRYMALLGTIPNGQPLTLAEVRDGTGFPAGQRFVPIG